MFDKPALDRLFADLREKYGSSAEWEHIVRQTHLGVAYSDANVSLKEKSIDPRVVEIIEKHRG